MKLFQKLINQLKKFGISADKINIEGKKVKFKTNTKTNYTYSATDLENIRKYIMGEGTLTQAQIDLYDVNNDGRITAADYTMISNKIGSSGGTFSYTGTFEINPDSASENIIIRDNTGKTITSIGLYGAKTRYLGILQAVIDNLITKNITMKEEYISGIPAQMNAYINSDNEPEIELVSRDAQNTTIIKASEIETSRVSINNAGYAMYGLTTGHEYKCDWQGDSRLHFYVDVTDVGNVSDKRLKTDIKEVDEDLIKAIGELDYKQFKKDNRNGLVSVGIIAQDLIEILNKYGKNAKDYELLEEFQYKLDDETLYYRIDYEQFLLLRMMAKEQEIKELQAKDTQKDNLIQSLIERIEKLEAK